MTKNLIFEHFCQDAMVSQKNLRLNYAYNFAPKGLKSSKTAKQNMPEFSIKLVLTIFELWLKIEMKLETKPRC